MPKARSPVLGFNHNVKHMGWLFHVQTEDSGIANPHIFTHLFHAGTILASKKMVYDNEASVDVVKGLMQAQHKSVLKELKSGKFDGKIKQYLGDPPAADGPEYADMTVDAAPEAAPAEVTEPITERQLAAPVPPAGAAPPAMPLPPPADDGIADVSAAFRAISHASAQMAAAAAPPRTGNTAPPPLASTAAAPDELVFAPPASAPVPPGSGAWSGKPEITQERPFDKSGSYPSVRPPGEPRSARNTSSPVPGTQPPSGKPSSQPPVGKAPTTPPSGSRPVRSPTVPPSRPVAPQSGRPAGGPPTIPPGGRPPPVPANAPAAKPGTNPGVRPAPRPSSAVPVAAPAQPTAPTLPVQKPGSVPPAGSPPRPAQGTPNVIVARPAVIVGAPPQVVGGPPGTRPPAGRPREAAPAPGSDSIFGKDLISEKSLDEVIMAYLSEDLGDE